MAMPAPPLPAHPERELVKCATSPWYFIDQYTRIYDPTVRDWISFRLWPAQCQALEVVHREQLIVALKARQLGMSWLVLAYSLWAMIFRPSAKVLVFSRREEDAIYLLGDERLRGMHAQMPAWITATMHARCLSRNAAKTWDLANGSVAHAFPSNAGDSYTATFALVDEADLVPDLGTLLGRVKPTVEAGGKLVLLSRTDKKRPQSEFKKTYAAAKEDRSPWRHLFLPWDAHPGRSPAWYAAQAADILTRTGSLDDLHEQYPSSDVEALSPRTLDKRLAPAWLQQCYGPLTTMIPPPVESPAVVGLEVYARPQAGHSYVIGCDPAEGNPTSDDSALTVLDVDTGEEVAALAGKLQPAVLAHYADQLGQWYNGADVMIERNNHGHAVLQWFDEHSQLTMLTGHDDHPGWLSSQRGKVLLYDACADAFRNRETVLHSFASYTQLSSIDGSTLRAPEGEHDDRADSYALACAGRVKSKGSGQPIVIPTRRPTVVDRLPKW